MVHVYYVLQFIHVSLFVSHSLRKVRNDENHCANMMYDERTNVRILPLICVCMGACALIIDIVTATDIVDYDCCNNIIVYY